LSASRCLSCGAETSNGLALCELCQRKARVDLEFLPVYFRNLARWRPGRAGSRQVPGSREPGRLLSGGDRVGRTLDEIGAHLVGWAEALDDDRPGIRWPLDLADLAEAEQAVSLCGVFAEHVASIATTEWGGVFAMEISGHEDKLRRLTEAVVPGWYAGACMRIVTMEGSECGGSTYVVPGLTWANCTRCGATTYARDHLAVILAEARGWVAPPKRLAEAIVALVDGELSVPRLYDRIRQWASRGDLKPIHRTVRDYVYDDDADALVVANVQTGRARYRFGEVFDLLDRNTLKLLREAAS